MGRKTQDLAGQRFGRLRVLSRIPREPGAPGQARWLCQCAPDLGGCGTMASVGSAGLRSGATQSCGCLQRERTAASNAIRAGRDTPSSRKAPVPEPAQTGSTIVIRRATKTRLRTADPSTWRNNSPSYNSWISMIYRCTKPDYPRYKDWGGRGITIEDPRWMEFDNFLADMGERPAGTSLNRKDNDGPYAKWNCEWTTPHEQQVNSRLFKLTPEVITEVKRLRATGLSMRAIGVELHLNRKTVSNALSSKGRSRKPDTVNGITGGDTYG